MSVDSLRLEHERDTPEVNLWCVDITMNVMVPFSFRYKRSLMSMFLSRIWFIHDHTQFL
jgi:hypothetical protein